MNWKKRGLVLMLALSLVLCLAACGNETSDDAKEPEENVQEETQQGGEQSTAHGGEADEIHLVYQRFQSALQQMPDQVQLLPARLQVQQREEAGNDYIFEPDARSVLENMVQLYLNNMVYSVLLEAKVSEQASRMAAMSAATDATTELINDLSLQLNRVRQAAITTEIAEIVGGANALKKAKK